MIKGVGGRLSGNCWIIISMSQELSTAVLQTAYMFAVSFAMMALVLLLKPEGIFGGAK